MLQADSRRQADYILKNADVIMVAVVKGVRVVHDDSLGDYAIASVEPVTRFKGDADTLYAAVNARLCGAAASFRVGESVTYAARYDKQRRAWIEQCFHGMFAPLFPALNKYFRPR